MALKSLVRELKRIKSGAGTKSEQSFDAKHSHHKRVQSHSAVMDVDHNSCHNHNRSLVDCSEQLSCWANLPPELLRDVLHRVETSENTWPARKHVVACAAVCRTWRAIIKALVKMPEDSGKLTFPKSLKESGPRDTTVQCFIKRDQANSTYHLYLGLTPALLVENGKFLLAARRFRRPTRTYYIISLNADDMIRESHNYLGKLRSNFLGTKFTIYDSQPLHSGTVVPNSQVRRYIGCRQVSPRLPAVNYNVAHIAYELNVLGTRGPRRMQCILYSTPSAVEAAIDKVAHVPPSAEISSFIDEDSFSSLSFDQSIGAISDFSSSEPQSITSRVASKDGPLILKNKAPRWHEQLQCWCLNFRGRVTVASVKNFQLVADTEATQQGLLQGDQDKVLLQFGKIGKDMFTMDYRYPLSAFQAFAICLSSFDTKLACE